MQMTSWRVAGSYYEACSCEAVCPCRRQGDRPGGRSTYGVCDFVLSWFIQTGAAGELSVADRRVVMAGSYDDDQPGSPWSVVLYLDERCTPRQRDALADIFLGRAGGRAFTNYARAIGTVHAVRTAAITLDHATDRERIGVGRYVTVRTRTPFHHRVRVSCGIPGHDRPGQELVVDLMRVQEPGLSWDLRGRCGFATTFDYRSS
jgi:hypothetical protein